MTGKGTKEISVFVDESGSFDPLSSSSQFYIVCMVFHDQAKSIVDSINGFNAALKSLGLDAVKSILKDAFALFSSKTEFVEEVTPDKYKLFQVADMIATLELVRLKLDTDGRISDAEKDFFLTIQNLKKNFLKPTAQKLYI